MIDIALDKSRAVRIFARVNETSVAKTLTFLNADGSDHDISSYDFKLFVQKRANTTVKLFTLSIGSGLTVQNGNELLIEISETQASVPADTYFWRLYSADEDHTWLNGPFVFHNGEFDDTTDETTVEITEGETIIIEVSGGGIDHWRGDWSTADEYPSTGGNGPGGVAKAGDRWRNTVLSILDVYPLGSGTVVQGNAVFEALIDDPQDPEDWKVYQ